MQEITERLNHQAIKDLTPLALRLAKEGKDDQEIAYILKGHLDLKSKSFYENDRKKTPEHISKIIHGVVKEKADSKAESIFYRMLIEAGFKFEFQYSIGPYRADYLFDGFLVIELDGPQHDKEYDKKRDTYMRKMGYKIIRIPLWILTADPRAVIEEIGTALVKETRKRNERKGKSSNPKWSCTVCGKDMEG